MEFQRESGSSDSCDEEAIKPSFKIFVDQKTNDSHPSNGSFIQSCTRYIDHHLDDRMFLRGFYFKLKAMIDGFLHFTSAEFQWATAANEFQAFKSTNNNLAFGPFVVFFCMIFVVRRPQYIGADLDRNHNPS